MSLLSDVVGGIFGNEAADKAADAQVQASKNASKTTMDMFNRGLQMTAPNQQAGWNALAMQGSLLGMPNMVPQGAIQGALDAANPDAKWQAYLQQYRPEIEAYFNKYQKSFKKTGSDWTRAAEKYYNEQGSRLGHQMPTGVAGGTPGGTASTGIGVGTSVDDAYNTFLDSGFGRSALETTNADWQRMVGAYGAGGKALSGSALIGLNDVNRRNTAGAFNNYYNALSGISGTGAQLGSQQAGYANQAGSQIANNQIGAGNARASSYLTQGQNNAMMADSAGNALSYIAGVKGWFG